MVVDMKNESLPRRPSATDSQNAMTLPLTPALHVRHQCPSQSYVNNLKCIIKERAKSTPHPAADFARPPFLLWQKDSSHHHHCHRQRHSFHLLPSRVRLGNSMI